MQQASWLMNTLSTEVVANVDRYSGSHSRGGGGARVGHGRRGSCHRRADVGRVSVRRMAGVEAKGLAVASRGEAARGDCDDSSQERKVVSVLDGNQLPSCL